MLKKRISQLVERYCSWHLAHLMLGAVVIVLFVVFVLQLVIPVRTDFHELPAQFGDDPQQVGRLLQLLQEPAGDLDKVLRTIRPSLFRAATGISDKPMADKTIERIRSQIKLQCIMQISGEPVAYINIKGAGLKKCAVGECVEGLFTVVSINKRSVETTIIGHKVVFTL